LLGLSKHWPFAVFFSGAERIGKGFRTPSTEAIIADSAPKQKGLGFGVHRALDTSGAIVGTIVTLILLSTFMVSFKTIIIVASTIGMISIIPLQAIKEKKPKPLKRTLMITLGKLPKRMKFFILAASIFSFANFSYMFFLLRVNGSVFLYLISVIFYAAGAIPMGLLTDKIGRRRVIAAGYALFSLVSITFFYAKSFSLFVVLFALYGIVNAIVEGNQRALVADLTSEREKGTSLGAFHSTTGVFSLIGNLAAGFLWKYVSPGSVFIMGGIVSFVATLTCISMRKKG
jgi:MFS family permease